MNLMLGVVLLVIGAACIAIGLRAMFINSRLYFNYFWFVLGLVLVIPGVLALTGAWATLPKIFRGIYYAILAIFLVYEVIAHAIIMRHFHDKAPEGLDYVIVLGSRVIDGRPGRALASRLDAALAYLEDNPQTRCVACGGKGVDELVSEAEAERDYLVARGIDANRIILEDKSVSTIENFTFAAKLIDPVSSSVAVVSNDYHIHRALIAAHKAGFVHVEAIAAKAPLLFPISDTVRETLALLKERVSGS